MKAARRWLQKRYLIYGLVSLGVAGLYLFKLGSLTKGFSPTEMATLKQTLGWNGFYHQPLYLPLKLIQSIIFKIWPGYGLFLGRLPNVLLGLIACYGFYLLIRLWHNKQVAALASILFLTSAWVLHSSRLASNDGLYLFSAVSLALLYVSSQTAPVSRLGYFGRILLIDLLIFIPGLIWPVWLTLYLIRASVLKSWQTFNSLSERTISLILLVLPWPLLIYNFRVKANLLNWLGLPLKWPSLSHQVKEFAAVFVHLFIRGPEYPSLWLAKAPLFNVFILGTAALGAVYYISRYKTQRSRFLGLFFMLAYILVALGGPVSISILVPAVLLLAATGLAYLLHEWFKVFPFNPLARTLGLSLIVLAIAISALYGLKAYFVAWPHNPTTSSLFRYRR